jgi:hypothetical protein
MCKTVNRYVEDRSHFSNQSTKSNIDISILSLLFEDFI